MVVGSGVAAIPAAVASTYFLLPRSRPMNRLIVSTLKNKLRLIVPIRRKMFVGLLVRRVAGELVLMFRRAPIASMLLLAPSSIVALVAQLDAHWYISPVGGSGIEHPLGRTSISQRSGGMPEEAGALVPVSFSFRVLDRDVTVGYVGNVAFSTAAGWVIVADVVVGTVVSAAGLALVGVVLELKLMYLLMYLRNGV